jgi:hypothetical protein
MDQIVSAILAVLPALAAETATSAVKDAYAAFKAVVQRKWGERGDVSRSLGALEQAPRSEQLAKDLQRSVAASGLHQDEEIVSAIKRLVEAHTNEKAAGSTAKFEQSGGTMTGVGAIGTNTGSINFGRK